MTLLCAAKAEHAGTVRATQQVSLYKRVAVAVPVDGINHPTPTLVWRGVCCDECLEEALRGLDRYQQHVAVVWRIR